MIGIYREARRGVYIYTHTQGGCIEYLGGIHLNIRINIEKGVCGKIWVCRDSFCFAEVLLTWTCRCQKEILKRGLYILHVYPIYPWHLVPRSL